jgi:hypothetical protein
MTNCVVVRLVRLVTLALISVSWSPAGRVRRTCCGILGLKDSAIAEVDARRSAFSAILTLSFELRLHIDSCCSERLECTKR